MKPAEVMWSAAPDGMKLLERDAHVFSAPLDVPAKRLEELVRWLSGDELLRAKRFHIERDRRRFIAGRGTLREILGALLNSNPTSLVFAYSEFGKPQIAWPMPAHSLHFNMAHSDSIAVYATSRHALGVDLERIRAMDEMEQIVSRFFSQREVSCLLALPVDQRLEAFFNGWTRKEAYLKAIGLGLDDCLHQIEVSLSPDEPAELLAVPNGPTEWFLHRLSPAAGFAAALAVQQRDSRVNCWTWAGLP